MGTLITVIWQAAAATAAVWVIVTLYDYLKSMLGKAKEEDNDKKWNDLSEKQNRAWHKFIRAKKEREKDDE